MVQDNKISMPSGFGGLMRFDEEFKSRFMITPAHVIALVIAIIAFRVFLGFWFG